MQRAAGSLESDSSPAGSTMALGTDCVVRSTWVYCHAEMSINQSQWFSVHVSRKNSTLTSRCPAAVECSSTLHRATCVLGPSSPCGAPLFPAEAARVHAQISIAAHFFPQNTRSLETRSPFCFTFSKGTTRSDNKLGTPLRCAVCCCCCCCCGGCGGCCCNTDGGRCISSLTPGGN